MVRVKSLVRAREGLALLLATIRGKETEKARALLRARDSRRAIPVTVIVLGER